MSNFEVEFQKGQKGGNKGLPLGPGLSKISKSINGLQRGMMYGVAASPKVGKSTFVDYGFVIHPYLYAVKHNIKLSFVYFSFEMDRISKEFDFASYFLFHDYKIKKVKLPDGITVNGQNVIDISSSYLRGRIQDDNNETIKIDSEIEKKLFDIYQKRIIPIFGKYSQRGVLEQPGVIDFIEQKENPTGLRNKLLSYARERGDFVYEKFTTKEGVEGKKLVGYKPKDPDAYVVVVTDTIRKIPRERNFTLKETIDKYLEYSTELRNLCRFSFIHIVHLNRSMADVQRMKYLGDMLYPTPEDIKDTGNLSEEADHLFTLFNPNDERYNLTSHFGAAIKDSHGNEIYKNLRTVHLVESRHVEFPQHFRLEMEGNVKNFSELNI